MLRTTILSLFFVVSFSSSTSLLRKSISRRQSEPTYCQAIEGFDCKCSSYRVTCTSDRVLPSQINVLANEKQKYPSVELVISGAHEQHVYEYTFEPVRQLYKPDADNLEFRIKFEKFTALHLPASAFNRVFPDNLPATARKNLALEIYNPEVQPNDNVNLFANLNVDSLELYVLYSFRGTFQQLFNGANIKYLRLSGGDIRSDLSQPFTGNIGRLELAKQAGQINVQTFPIYPAHELIINAFYVNDFTSTNPPNYSNLGELRIYTQERVPANAFQQYPNLHTLSISTDKDIDPHAFDGLYNLEKLTIKDTKPSLEILNSLPNLKEFEASLEKLNEREQCELVDKLAKGQIAVQAIPSGRECTCASAYLDTASGRYPCEALNCDQSSCPAIRTNYNASARTFKAPPAIRRADGTDALRQREPKVYTTAYQISNEDREKSQQGAPPPSPPQQQPQQPSEQEGDQQLDGVTPPGQSKKSRRTRPRTQPTTPSYEQQPDQQHPHHPENQTHSPFARSWIDAPVRENERSLETWDYPTDYEDDPESKIVDNQPNYPISSSRTDEDTSVSNTNDDPNIPVEEQQQQQQQQPQGEEGDSATQNEGGDNPQGEDTNENPQEGGTSGSEDGSQSDPNQVTEAMSGDTTISTPPAKRGLSWLPIIIIIASIAVLLLIGLIVLIVRKRRTGYNQANTSEPVAARK